jgi:hypothetical protein
MSAPCHAWTAPWQELSDFAAGLVPRFCLEFPLINTEAETGNKSDIGRRSITDEDTFRKVWSQHSAL